jgi:Na+-transporting NADH:ubiquinone oxidoreductase subunit NqrD
MNISKLVLSLVLSITLLTQASWAQMASTEALFKQPVTVSSKEKVIQFTAREDVRKILGQMDVDPKMIEARVASMTDEEASQIANEIETLPAGSDAIGSIVGAAVFVFVVLLITDLLGFTKVFGFTKTIR